MNYYFNSKTSIEKFNSIKEWLKDEYLKSKEGFYCNIDTIEKAFYNKEFLSFEINNESIGFVVYSNFENFCIQIDIVEIHPQYRNKGIGNIFYNEIENYFKKKKFKVIELYCSPKESEIFWLKMNFIKYPKSKYKHELTYYKPIIKTQNQFINNIEVKNKIEVWNLETYQIKDQNPNWVWNLDDIKEILIPCNIKWRIRLTKDTNIIKDNSIKYFEKEKNKIYFHSYLYINKKNLE